MGCEILAVNPNNRVISFYAGLEQPLFAGLFLSDQRNKGKDVKILDAEILDLTVAQTIEAIRNENPSQVVIFVLGQNPSVSSTPKMKVTKQLVDQLIGDVDLKVAGLHVSALPQQTKAELGVEVLRGKIFDGTPDMPYDLYPMEKYISHGWHNLDGTLRQPYAVSYASLNCSQNCRFCNVSALYGYQHKVFYRDIDKFLAEIDLLVNKYKVRNIKLFDEHFTVNKQRVNEICDRLIERRYDLNIWAYARVDTVDQQMLDKMWKAGFNWLGFGFESGSDKVLDTVNKRANLAQAKRVVKMVHDAGINVMGNFILGLESDTIETMNQTMEFAKNLDIEFINLTNFECLPGSPAYREQQKDWDKYSQFSTEKDKMRQFRDEAFNDYFLNPNYLNHIRQKFGEQSVTMVKKMVAEGKPKTRGG